jgi:hypothetical protein
MSLLAEAIPETWIRYEWFAASLTVGRTVATWLDAL